MLKISNDDILQERPSIDLKGLYFQLNRIVADLGDDTIIKEEKILSRVSVWRWENFMNKGLPSCTTVLKLLEKHSNLESISEMACHYGGEIEKFLQSSFPTQFIEPHLKINKEVDRIKDYYEFYIYFLCGNEKRITREEIIRTMGNIACKKAEIPEDSMTEELITSMGRFANEKIDKLMAQEFLIEEEGFLQRTTKNTYIRSQDKIFYSTSFIKDIINPDSWPTGVGLFYLTSESIEPHIAKEVSEDLCLAYKKAKEKVNQHKSTSPTAIPFAISVMGERMIPEKQEGGIQ